MGDIPKLVWSRDVTGKVVNIHSNLFRFLVRLHRHQTEEAFRYSAALCSLAKAPVRIVSVFAPHDDSRWKQTK